MAGRRAAFGERVAALAHVLDDADDGVERAVGLPSRILPPSASCAASIARERAVDHDDARSVHAVASPRRRPSTSDAERLQIVAGSGPKQCVLRIVGIVRHAVDGKPRCVPGTEKRQQRGIAGAFDAGQRPDIGNHPVVERQALRRLLIFRLRQCGPQGQHVIRAEAELERAQVGHRAQHQTGASEQHQRGGHLKYHERVARQTGAAADRRASALLDRIAQRRARLAGQGPARTRRR